MYFYGHVTVTFIKASNRNTIVASHMGHSTLDHAIYPSTSHMHTLKPYIVCTEAIHCMHTVRENIQITFMISLVPRDKLYRGILPTAE